MMLFLKEYSFSIILSLALLVLPLILPFENKFWFLTPLIILIWMLSAYHRHRQFTQIRDQATDKQDENLRKSIDRYSANLTTCVSDEVGRYERELFQLKTIIADAVEVMSKSFNNLHVLSSGQSTLVNTLARDLEGAIEGENATINFTQFTQKTDDVLRFFIEHILQVSKQSMEMVAVIRGVGEHMAHVERLLADVQKIADQTNLLALNAAIEAASAGEAGPRICGGCR